MNTLPIPAKLLLAFFALITVSAFGQTEEVDSLQKLVAENEEKARKAEIEAVKNRKEADVANKEAVRQRYLSAAQQMAYGSSQVNNNELAALLAVQAFRFNEKKVGNPMDHRVYEALTGALGRNGWLPPTLPVQGSQMMAVQASGLVTLGSNGKLIRWTKPQGAWKSEETSISIKWKIASITLSSDGQSIVIRSVNPEKSSEASVELWNFTGSVRRLTGTVALSDKIVASPRGGFYALSNSSRTIGYFDSKESRDVIKTKEDFLSVDVSSDGSRIVGVSATGHLMVINTIDNKSHMLNIPLAAGDDIRSFAYVPNSSLIVLGNKLGDLLWVDTEDGRIVRTITNTSQAIEIKLSPSGTYLATRGPDKMIRIKRLNSASDWPIRIQSTSGSSWEFTPDEKEILFADDSQIRILSFQMNELATSLCGFIHRNLTKDEWNNYIGPDLPYERTCN